VEIQVDRYSVHQQHANVTYWEWKWRGAWGCVWCGFLLLRRGAARVTGTLPAFLHVPPQKAKPNTSAFPPPRLGKGQGMSASNWALMVFYKHRGGRGAALHPTERAHTLLHFRSTKTVNRLSSPDVAAQYGHWECLKSGWSLLGSSLLLPRPL